jgi:curved DNA-binding protein CbpA
LTSKGIFSIIRALLERVVLTNYYKILGVGPSSSVEEVKSSFRKKAKQLHPDVRYSNPSIQYKEGTDQGIKLLLKAYEILSNPRKRIAYDRFFRRYKLAERKKFNYRKYLLSRPDDLACQSRLIFYDLLHSHSEEAVALYEKLLSYPYFRLELYLDWEDYMDCTFLLAEQFDNEGDHERAFKLFLQLYYNEQKRPCFKHFIEEIAERIKRIACINLKSFLSPELNIRYLEELLSFDYPRKDIAVIYKKIAEAYLEIGDTEKALESLAKGLEFNQKLAGVKKLKEKIGFPEICVS